MSVKISLYSVSLFLMVLFITACGQNDSELIDENLPLSDQIDRLIENDRYETALSLLEDMDREDPEVLLQLEKTHLNYGLYSMNTFDQTEMRTRMNNALVQFTEVLRINPNNAMAREQIEQIMMIYDTIPGREPEPEVLEGLREVGFNY
ncbi:MAG: hypothetical protein EA391_10265 [Balneolaceae bacterium]|nr:MAG: hypothetical protein EA391_10265 [Balneolaceae bacterium]